MAFSLAQKTANSQNGTASISVAYSSNVTAGDLLIAVVGADPTAQPPTGGVSDTQGNVWANIATQGFVDSFAILGIYYAIAGTTGPNTVSWSGGGSSSANLMIVALDYTGISGPTLDIETYNNGGGKDAVMFEGGPTSEPNEICVAACIDVGGSSSTPIGDWAATGGYTIEETGAVLNASAPLYSGMAVADQIVSAIGTFDTDFSDNGSGQYGWVLASFYGTAAPTPPATFEISLFGTKRFVKPKEAECTEAPVAVPVKLWEVE